LLNRKSDEDIRETSPRESPLFPLMYRLESCGGFFRPRTKSPEPAAAAAAAAGASSSPAGSDAAESERRRFIVGPRAVCAARPRERETRDDARDDEREETRGDERRREEW
jgi:hypothetical protein